RQVVVARAPSAAFFHNVPAAMQSSLDARHVSAVTASASPIVLGNDFAGVGITEFVQNGLELLERNIRSVSGTLLVRLDVAEVPISPDPALNARYADPKLAGDREVRAFTSLVRLDYPLPQCLRERLCHSYYRSKIPSRRKYSTQLSSGVNLNLCPD